ncbi:MAG: sulfite exporter TauE/SafE family protein [Janthinobacterium lividum]
MARPDLSYLKSVFLFLFGIPLGLITGLTGVSGSVFGIPAVRRLLGLRPARAVGVGLTLTFFAALAGILSYAQHGEVQIGLALLLFVFQTIGALAAERLLVWQPRLERLSLYWGLLVTAGGLAMLAQGFGYLHGLPLPQSVTSHSLTFYLLAAMLAAVVGLISRVFGLGGVLIVPAVIYGLGLSPHAAQGTALVVLALAGLPGMLAHLQRGDVEPQAATWLSAGAVLGALTGALIAVTQLSEHSSLLVFGLLLTALGLMLLWRRDAAAIGEQLK